MRRGMLLAILLILTGTASAADTSGQLFMKALVPGAIVFSVILVAGANMIAEALSMPYAKAWAQTEVRELITGAILIAIVLGGVLATNQAAQILTGESDVAGAAQKVTGGMLNNITKAYRADILIASRVGALSGYSYSYPVPLWFFGFGYSNGAWNGYSILRSAPSGAAGGLSNSLFIYTAINTLLKFFKVAIPGYIFPLGFALRMIPFTRKIGGTIIALGIGAYVAFPFAILLVGEFHKNIDVPDPMDARLRYSLNAENLEKMSLTLPSAMNFFCENKAPRIFMNLTEIGWWLIIGIPASIPCLMGFFGCLMSWYTIITNIFYPLVAMILQIVFGLTLLISNEARRISPAFVYSVVQTTLKQANNLVVLTYVDALAISIVTYIGAKGVSSAIGGEGYLMGVQRLI